MVTSQAGKSAKKDEKKMKTDEEVMEFLLFQQPSEHSYQNSVTATGTGTN